MFFRVMLFEWQFVLDLVAVMQMTDDEKDLEIMVLRQQLWIVERKQERGPQIPRWQKVPLAALAVRVKDRASKAREALAESVRLFKPDTLLGWHHAIVRGKWTLKQERKRVRPPVDRDLKGWILQVAHDNPTLGYDKLEGELRKLGFDVGATTIRTVLLRHGVPPAPERSRQGSSWRTFLNHYKDQFLTCDFFAHLNLSVFHRARDAPGILRRLPGASELCLGHPASAADDLGVGEP
jgi:putative transposase